MEKFYLYKCKMVLDSVRINPGVPLAPLERIYDQLEEALQYTEKSTLPLNKKEVAREILQTRNYYAEERKRLLQIFPELEPFVKTIQHVELEMSRLDGFCPTNDHNGDDDTQSYNKAQPEQFPPNLDKLQLIPGVRDLILQAQKIPRPEQYNLFEPTVQPMGNLAKPQRTSKVQNQNMNDHPSLSERHYKESSLPGLHTDATHPSSYTNYKCTLRHNTDSMETGEHQQLSGDVQLFFRQYENLYNTRRDTDTNDPTAWLAPEDTKNVRSHLTSTRPNPMDEPNMLPHEAALPTAGQGPCLTHGSISGEGTKYGAKCHPSKVVGHKYFGPCRPDLLKRKSKYSAKSLVNKRKISKDKKIPYKILTRGKTLEDFIYETNHAKPVRALGDPSTTRRNVNRNSQHRTTSSSLSIKYVSNDSKYASNERKYASDERKYAPHESKYTANDSKYASNERKYGSDERKYASSDSELVSNDQYLSDDYPYMEYDGSFIPRDKYVSNESQYALRGNKYVPSKYASNDLQYFASDKYIANDEYDSSSQHIQRKYASIDHKPHENQFAALSTSHQYKSLSCNKLESKKDLFSTTCKRTLFRISQSCVNTRLTTENSHQGSRGVQTKCLASTSEHCPRSEEAERHSNRTQSREHCAEQEIYEYCPQNNYSKVRRTSNKINKDVTLDWLFRFKTHKSGSRTDSSGKTESHHYSHSIQDPPKSHPYPTTQTLQSHHTTLLSQLTTVHHSRRTTSHNSLHKSDKMKRALNLAYSSETLDKGFNFVSVRETLKRFRIYRHRSRGEKKTDQQISVELMLTRLRPGDVFKYNINHYV
ncbi:uncharacterized protein LOC103520754 isoform X2 [Diaphorina citri]|uniref:Uncharacterized protein LOC103520754 isoform X1 n=1 Tax=Diaphorina citri TaxID=121845 RepID=A0A1S3DLP9_DIACI|nr:uncharacterized protein LOC103520754 isoform X1 [Diaphorina citri]XP_026687550.1 uncharacterized protein LOC103520754 isoform X2 [Diaphorina citri]